MFNQWYGNMGNDLEQVLPLQEILTGENVVFGEYLPTHKVTLLQVLEHQAPLIN